MPSKTAARRRRASDGEGRKEPERLSWTAAPEKKVRRGFGATFDAAIAGVAALACLVFVMMFRDTLSRVWGPPPVAPAMMVESEGDAACDVHIVDSEGHPLPGAVVRLFYVESSTGDVFLAGEQWTRGQEVLAFDGLPRGEIWVVAYGPEKSRASTRVFFPSEEVEGTLARRTVTLALRSAHALAVRVVDPAGKSIQDATVSIKSNDVLPHVILTDAEGAASFVRLGPPPWAVEVEAEGYDPVSKSGVYPDTAPLEVRLERLGGLEISVVDDEGEAVANAEVLLSGPGIWPARTALTDEQGSLTVMGLYAGLYDIKAREGGRVSQTDMNVTVSQGKLVERTLTLEDGRYITVTVTDGPMRADGVEPKRVDGAAVLVVEEGLSSFVLEEKTNKYGVARLGPLGKGAVTVSARAAGFVSRVVGASAIHEDEAIVPLLRGGTFLGEVVDERGYAVDGATIEVFGTDLDGMPIRETSDRSSFRDDLFEYALAGPLPLIGRGELGVMPGPIPPIPHASSAYADGSDSRPVADPWVTNTDGSFHAGPVTPGRVQVLVRHPEYTEWISEVLTMAPGETINLKVVLNQGARLEGRVIEEDRLAVEGARVEIAANAGTYQTLAYTSEDGSFAAASVPESVLVTVYRPESTGEVAARLELHLRAGQRAEVEIVLPKERDRTIFRFVDESKLPVPRVEVHVVSLDLETVLYRTHFTSDDGLVEVSAARGLPLRVVAERPGRAPLVALIDAAEREHTFVMEPGRTLRGFVTGYGKRVKVEGADVTLFTLGGARHVTTDEEGTFTVEDLAPGRIRLRTRAKDFADDVRVIAFDGDARRITELETIDLVRSGTVEGTVVDDSGAPIAGARVGLGGVPTYLPVGRLPYGVAQTNVDGVFSLGSVPEGSVLLEAYSPELGRGRLDGIEVRAGRVTDSILLTIPAQDYDPRKMRAAGSVAVTLSERDGRVVILDVPEGGEAELAGVEPEDRLMRVAGANIRTIEQARDRLSGPLAEDVIVELEREVPGGVLDVKLRVRREAVRR